MPEARLVITAVTLEKRPVSEVARTYRVAGPGRPRAGRRAAHDRLAPPIHVNRTKSHIKTKFRNLRCDPQVGGVPDLCAGVSPLPACPSGA
jgi:hypothetical protein